MFYVNGDGPDEMPADDLEQNIFERIRLFSVFVFKHDISHAILW